MQRRLWLGGIALVLALGPGCGDVEINAPGWPGGTWPNDPPANAVRDTSEWRGDLAPGWHIEIKSVFGNIRAVRTTGAEVVVMAIRIGGAEAVDDVRIEAVTHAAGVTICAVYPDVPGQAPNACQPGLGGNMSVWDGGRGVVRVDFVVQVPEGVTFIGRTVTGTVDATGLDGNAFLHAVSGGLRVSTAGLATATTVTGSVTATIGLADWDRDLAFTTTVGDLDVTIPGDANAEVWATAPSGRISTAFPLRSSVSGGMRGTIGSGGPLLRLTTVAGDITLRRGS
ncbi:MAG: DUF4097 domain-containing protein [Gemmatimonadota bacterium]|nr:DUF4097 domain-containing protein [Gemmatimonadota bacterium]MDH4350402.1 DUF4097 domain-containing protein [Gemmatimonadota bacterium]MDH5196903.1 DUF4097 domain-containing protein [Gemmatimonadota bacterium]